MRSDEGGERFKLVECAGVRLAPQSTSFYRVATGKSVVLFVPGKKRRTSVKRVVREQWGFNFV